MNNSIKLCLMFLIFSYANASASNYHVIGKLTGFREGTKVYLLDKDLESTTLKKGGFYLNGQHLKTCLIVTTMMRFKPGWNCGLYLYSSGNSQRSDRNDFNPFNAHDATHAYVIDYRSNSLAY